MLQRFIIEGAEHPKHDGIPLPVPVMNDAKITCCKVVFAEINSIL